MFRVLLFVVAVLGLFWVAPATSAQQPDLLVTSATVARDAGGRDVAYLAWDSTTPGLLRGRVYALYAKPGAPGDAGAFQRRGILPPLATSAALAPLVSQAAQLGFDPAALREPLTSLGAPGNASPAEQLAAVVTAARNDPKLTEMLVLLAKAHAAVDLALGRAWAEVIAPGTTTFELREFDPVAKSDIVTVARVTVVTGAATPLPPPGPPVQVPDLTSTGDLLIKLRWATPPDLRHRSPLLRGYNLWRLSKADAERLGWFGRAPTLAELVANAQRISTTPIFTAKDFDAITVLNPADPDAHYIDDNGRFTDAARAFPDGAEFAYVVTARDLVGRDGLPSLAGVGRACHTVPSRVPRGLKVENIHSFADQPGTDDHQWFRVSWLANANPPPDQPTHYELFRGTDLKELDAPGGPPAANLIAMTPHTAAGGALSFDDQSLVPEAIFFGKTFWFAIRARRDGACGPVYSAMSPPVFGTLQKIAAPSAPTGDVEGNCPFPVAAWTANAIAAERAPDDGRAHFRVECRRRGPGILWAEFTVRVPSRDLELQLGRFFFPDDLDTIGVDYALAVDEADNNIDLWCRVGSAEGRESNTASRPFERQLRPGRGAIAVDTFDAAELTTWDLHPGDPLAAGLFGQIQCFRTRSVEADGRVILDGVPGDGQQFTIVGRVFGGVAQLPERSVATVTAAEGSVSFIDPALVGRDPATVNWTYCGYPLNPNLIFGECPHLARPDGSGRVHFLRIRMKLNVDAREYRLYRRVDDGPLELVAQGAAKGSKAPFVDADDNAMPPRAATICYYGQLLDEHGNASPLALIQCRQLTANLPVPLLAGPQSGGDRTAPTMRLEWFCPTPGVERFEVFLRPVSGAIEPAKFTFLRKASSSSFNAKAIHFVRDAESRALAKLSVEESFLTGRVGGELDEGPEFGLAVPIAAGTTYDVWIKAVGPTGRRGQASATQRFTWRPPPPPRARVPWPARPLPPNLAFDSRISATTSIDCPRDRAAYPVGVRIGSMPFLNGRECSPEPGGPIVLTSTTLFNDLSSADPNRWLFRDELSSPPRTNVTVLPAVLYRQQVINVNFPKVSGDVIQVSPLIEKLAWGQVNLNRATRAAVLVDPFVGVKANANFDPVLVGPGAPLELILLDTRPVLGGARYRYWLLHFGQDGEPDAVIPAGEVDLP